MVCLICHAGTPYEVCNQCIRSEEKVLEDSWLHKEGFLGKKTEECKIIISSKRISGTALISTTESGSTGRFDTFQHYIGNVLEIKSGSYNGKPCPVIHIKNEETGMEKFILLSCYPDESKIKNAISKAKSLG